MKIIMILSILSILNLALFPNNKLNENKDNKFFEMVYGVMEDSDVLSEADIAELQSKRSTLYNYLNSAKKLYKKKRYSLKMSEVFDKTVGDYDLRYLCYLKWFYKFSKEQKKIYEQKFDEYFEKNGSLGDSRILDGNQQKSSYSSFIKLVNSVFADSEFCSKNDIGKLNSEQIFSDGYVSVLIRVYTQKQLREKAEDALSLIYNKMDLVYARHFASMAWLLFDDNAIAFFNIYMRHPSRINFKNIFGESNDFEKFFENTCMKIIHEKGKLLQFAHDYKAENDSESKLMKIIINRLPSKILTNLEHDGDGAFFTEYNDDLLMNFTVPSEIGRLMKIEDAGIIDGKFYYNGFLYLTLKNDEFKLQITFDGSSESYCENIYVKIIDYNLTDDMICFQYDLSHERGDIESFQKYIMSKYKKLSLEYDKLLTRLLDKEEMDEYGMKYEKEDLRLSLKGESEFPVTYNDKRKISSYISNGDFEKLRKYIDKKEVNFNYIFYNLSVIDYLFHNTKAKHKDCVYRIKFLKFFINNGLDINWLTNLDKGQFKPIMAAINANDFDFIKNLIEIKAGVFTPKRIRELIEIADEQYSQALKSLNDGKKILEGLERDISKLDKDSHEYQKIIDRYNFVKQEKDQYASKVEFFKRQLIPYLKKLELSTISQEKK